MMILGVMGVAVAGAYFLTRENASVQKTALQEYSSNVGVGASQPAPAGTVINETNYNIKYPDIGSPNITNIAPAIPPMPPEGSGDSGAKSSGSSGGNTSNGFSLNPNPSSPSPLAIYQNLGNKLANPGISPTSPAGMFISNANKFSNAQAATAQVPQNAPTAVRKASIQDALSLAAKGAVAIVSPMTAISSYFGGLFRR